MTDNRSTDFAHLFNAKTESLAYITAVTTTLAEVVTVHILDQRIVAFNLSGNDAEKDLRAVMTVSGETIADHLHYIMSAIVAPIVCAFGMAGNLLSIVTWNRRGMGSSTGRYLTGQAVANSGMLLMYLLCDSIQYWCPTIKYSVAYGILFSYFVYPIYFYTIMCSIWFTVGLTADRYIMVCWISKAKKLCSKSRATLGLSLIAINSFLINIPHFASFTPVHLGSITSLNSSSTKAIEQEVTFVASEFGSGQAGMIYDFWIHCFVLTFTPWVSVLVMNVRIVYKINKANRRMADKKTTQAVKKSKASENQITRLLLAVTFSFLFFEGVNCITHCLSVWKPPSANALMLSLSLAVGKTSLLFNSALNFVLYCLTGRRFRVELLKMMGFVKKDMLQSSSVNTSSSIVATTTATSNMSTNSEGY